MSRLVLVALLGDTVPQVPPWGSALGDIPVQVLVGDDPPERANLGLDAPVRVVPSAAGRRWRRDSTHRGAESARSWGRRLQRLSPLADPGAVVLSVDAVTDEVLMRWPELTGGAAVLDARHTSATGPAWRALQAWQDLLDWLQALVQDSHGRIDLELAVRIPPVPELDQLPVSLVPTSLVEATERLARRLVGTQSREVVEVLLDRLLLPLLQRRDTDRLRVAALREGVRLWRSQAEIGPETNMRLRELAEQTLQRADEPDGSLAYVHDALSLVLHRARHAKASHHSPLVDDPQRELHGLRACERARRLSDDSLRRPAFASAPRSTRRGRPRVVVLPGAYGAFHQDLVAALEPHAEVEVVDLLQEHALLAHKRPTIGDMQLLQRLRAGQVGRGPGPALAALGEALASADVVVSDWIDGAGMWASHLVPADTRLVLRAHSLDLLDPWMQLVDWRGVDRVLISNRAMGSLFADLVAGTGAPAPEPVRPYRPDLAGIRQDKGDQARFTLGMVGWGRPVKDVTAALDLLELDERRRLVLIGPPFPAPGPELSRPYVAEVRLRMASPALRDRIEVVGATDDVASALEQVGVILSCSIREGWHLGLIEGAASGAVPVVRDWSLLRSRGGARTLYPEHWVVDDLAAADARVSELADASRWRQESDRAVEDTLRAFDAEDAAARYRELVLGST